MADNFSFLSGKVNQILLESKDLTLTQNTVRTVRPNSIPKNVLGEGRMFMFKYINPKTRDELRYFHMFPVVYTLSVQPGYITGINFFYLPRRFRPFLLNFFMKRMSGGQDFPRSFMRYDIVNSLRRYRSLMAPAIKKYDMDRMGSMAIEFDSSVWSEITSGDSAELLESLWLKSSKSIVYKATIIKIIKSYLDTSR